MGTRWRKGVMVVSDRKPESRASGENAAGYGQKALLLREKGWDEGDKSPLQSTGAVRKGDCHRFTLACFPPLGFKAGRGES
jgi:hypothetical protein